MSRLAGSRNFGHPEIHGVADTADTQIEIGAERREMHVGRRDADDERRRRADAAQIDDVDVQNFTEKTCIRSEAALPEAAADDDLGSAPLGIGRIECRRLRTFRPSTGRREL